MITCPNCKHPVERDAERCPQCGFLLIAGQGDAQNTVSRQQALPLDDPAGAQGKASPNFRRLVVLDTDQELPFEFEKSELLIGRKDPESGIYPEVDLTGYGGEIGGVSRRHARLHLQDGQVFIEDLNSTNFTFLNRQRLQPGQLYHVHDGDEIRLGSLVMVYHAN